MINGAFTQNAKAQDQDDPPSRVARLGYMEGQVSFQPAGENEWVGAVPNRPMTTGDKLWVDRESRAEIQLGSSTIDMAPNTGFSFLNLDDRTSQMEVTAGAINVRVWHMEPDSVFEIDTPNQAFTIQQPGRYRVETSENGDYTVVTIREGAGESSGNGQSYTLHAGERTTFRGTTSLNADMEQIGPPDDFDNWSERREHRYDDSPSARYCSRQVVGFEDLDDNGDWQPSPEYGNVWFPRVEPGWAPYHNGHWAWIDPWGWTWVDDARWGYAPFHYGRWVNVYGRWGWVPGPPEVRPVYAPALVVFVGGGPGAGGNVAWFPLGPREVYVPSYHVSEGYVNRVNVSNTNVSQTNVTNVYNTTIVNNNTTINNVTYANRNVQGGVTAVPHQAFASAQPVSRVAVPVSRGQFANAPVMTQSGSCSGTAGCVGPTCEYCCSRGCATCSGCKSSGIREDSTTAATAVVCGEAAGAGATSWTASGSTAIGKDGSAGASWARECRGAVPTHDASGESARQPSGCRARCAAQPSTAKSASAALLRPIIHLNHRRGMIVPCRSRTVGRSRSQLRTIGLLNSEPNNRPMKISRKQPRTIIQRRNRPQTIVRRCPLRETIVRLPLSRTIIRLRVTRRLHRANLPKRRRSRNRVRADNSFHRHPVSRDACFLAGSMARMRGLRQVADDFI